MDFKAIIRYMPNFWASKDLISYLSLFVFLLLIVSLAFGRLGFAYNSAQETQQKIDEMISFVNDWNALAKTINQAQYRPISFQKVDDIQSQLLLLLSVNQLDLKTFKHVQSDVKKDDGLIFEMTFEGEWKSVVKVLANFHAMDALIGVQYVKMVPTKDYGVLVTIDYKIYVK